MTKDEFRNGLKEMLSDVVDPNGDFAEMNDGFVALANELSEHDPVLADKFMGVSRSVSDIVDYVRTRIEQG